MNSSNFNQADISYLLLSHLVFTFFVLHLLFPKAGLLESNGNAEEHDHAVTDLCTTLDGLLVAVAIQRQVSCYCIMSYFSSVELTMVY